MENGLSDSTTKQQDLENNVTDLVQILGQTLNTALLYGTLHKVTRSSLELTHVVISKFIELHDLIHFSIADGSLLINGASTAGSPLAAGLTSRLTGLNLHSFTIKQDFSLDESIALITLLLTPAAKLETGKSPAELMEGLGLLHIDAKSFTYRRVSEDEPAGGPATTPPAPEEPTGAEPVPDQPNLDNIMAFLKGDSLADSTRCAEDIRRLAADSEKLAELILRTVEVRTSMANLAEGESLTDLIVGCIQKVVHPILKDPAAKTQKGRKHIKHSLLMLEKVLLDRLKNMAGDQVIHATETLMDEIVEELDLDAIASKFMKNRRLAEQSGEKIAHLIERASTDPEQMEELRERLTDQGLTPEGWKELTVQFSPPPASAGAGGDGQGGTGNGANEIKVLTLLLARIGETIQHPDADGASPKVQSLIHETEEHLSALAELTDQKINTLQSMLTDEEKNPILSRSEILEILAEIAQEIMQPLTIITGTTAMLRSLRAGPLTETQGELLSMMAESGSRTTVLVNHLMNLAGTPKERQPDRAILDAAYQST